MNHTQKYIKRRPLRVLAFIGNAELRSVLKHGLQGHRGIQVMTVTGDPVEAAHSWTTPPDVMLCDFSPKGRPAGRHGKLAKVLR